MMNDERFGQPINSSRGLRGPLTLWTVQSHLTPSDNKNHQTHKIMSLVTHRFVRLAARRCMAVGVCPQRRSFVTTPAVFKSATEKVKDGLKSVDRAVSDNILIPAVDATAKVKETAQSVTMDEAKQKMKEMTGQAKSKTEQAKGDAAAKAEELKGDAKAKTEHVKGQVKGAAANVQSKL
ncbi:hypothetical protein L249_0034 [Ophiocordyceps polyrhachis-furcata BCC 54312]|uniref:Lea domain-containing protein n=1 Tax=Ophiocordyceps polyrhachis-furcata BCC 54312 TaxID=1330021 RepID=A0A367LEW9_9HYPO|nr:hypothetical protein L249_0034 [Ophiocordyceps polyrhachis-furcata BCC 54312]